MIYVSPVLAIGLPVPDLYRNGNLMSEYRDVAASTLKHFFDIHLNSSCLLRPHQSIRSSVLDLAAGVIDLESKLALALPLLEELLDIEKTYNKISIDTVQKLLPQVDLQRVLESLVPGFDSENIIVAAPDHLERLSFILSSTPKEVLQAFMSWKMIQNVADEVMHPKLRPLREFMARTRGAVQLQPAEPWRQCAREVNTMLGWILSRFFAEKTYTDLKANLAEDIVKDVKKSFSDMLTDTAWMNDEDTQRAVNKVEAIKERIGVPDQYPDVNNPGSIVDYYDTLNLTDSHFKNKLEFAKFEQRRTWSKLGHSANLDDWKVPATAVNAYYDYAGNEVVIPLGALQPPLFYDTNVPKYVSYGSLGTTAGHEIAHGFTPVGALFGKDGKLKDIFGNDTQAVLDSKAECLVAQYSKFKVNGPSKEHHVDGNLTLSENIADAVGARAAYLAWERAEKEDPAQVLPGLQQFTKPQLFWLSYGSKLCSKVTPAEAERLVLMDRHAPKTSRILVRLPARLLVLVLIIYRALLPTQKNSSRLSTAL
jgi:endothelin-converting enzyme